MRRHRGDGGLSGEDWNRPHRGSGAPLPAFRPSPLLARTRFEHRAESTVLTVDVDHDEQRAALYRDGVEVASGEMPVRFAVDVGRVEVSAGLYGMQRIHLVRNGGEQRLEPAAGTPERRRAQLAERHPGVSRAIATGAVAVLLVSLALFVPQLLDLVTHHEDWPFSRLVVDSPFALPAWLNTTITVLGAVAATERALTFRRHRVIDLETGWLDS